MLAGKCAEQGWHCLALAVQPDHSHLVVRVWPSDRAAAVVKQYKGSTAVTLRKEFPPLLTLPPSMGTRSTFARTAGIVSQETIQRYSAAQTRR